MSRLLNCDLLIPIYGFLEFRLRRNSCRRLARSRTFRFCFAVRFITLKPSDAKLETNTESDPER